MIGAINQILTPILADNGPGKFFWGGGSGFFGLAWMVFFLLGLLLCVWI